jgi:hypothetical protein
MVSANGQDLSAAEQFYSMFKLDFHNIQI